jgi:peptidyl-prolyl isomerase E (cyclophilin E)
LLPSERHRGFAFVEFEEEDDAADAIENMDGSELSGRVLRCNIAKALPTLTPGKAVWHSEDWIQNHEGQTTINPEDPDRVADLTLIPEKTEEIDDE